MHFGKIVKKAAYGSGISADEFAYMLGMTESELLKLYEQKDWLSGDIKLASEALDHDFGKYFNTSVQFDFMPAHMNEKMDEVNITIRYPKGKEFLLETWLNKMRLIAIAIGLQVKR